MRLIDANALAKLLSMEANVYRNNGDYARAEGIGNALWAIAHAPTVGGWISVKDALPMLDEEVLVYAIGKIEPFIGKHVFALCNRYIQRVFPSAPGHIMWSSPWQYFHTDYEITHWKPMPEGPKEEE